MCLNMQTIAISIKLHIYDVFNDGYDYECSITSNDVKNGKFDKQIRDSVRIFGNIIDEEGALTFTLIDSKTELEIVGQFIDGLDTLKSQVLNIDPIAMKEYISVAKYFEPLENGKWKYSSSKHKKTREIEYCKGVLKENYVGDH